MLKFSPMLVLASNSPRRSRLLSLGGWSFTRRPSTIDEEVIQGEAPDKYVLRIAQAKAKDVAVKMLAEGSGAAFVLAADTAVVFNGKIIGKPRDHSQAGEFLRLLRGKEHLVYSGLSLISIPGESQVDDICITRVKMRQYTDREILDYVASGDPMDKAGAYAVQNQEFLPAESISGCLTNVMGLPLCRLVTLMKRLGMEVPRQPVYPCLYKDQSECSFSVDQL